MIWHIFKKDCLLLWPLAVIVTMTHVANTLLSVVLGQFGEPMAIRVFENIVPLVSIIGMMVLVAAVVLQDAVPDVTQEWLIRPIWRTDLLLAKLLFIVLIVILPLIAVDMVEGIADGFPFSVCIDAALSDGISQLILICLPAALVATVASNLTQLIAGAIALLVLSVGFTIIANEIGNHAVSPTSGGGLAWIRGAIIAVMIVVAAAAVLPRQYFRRATSSSRWVIACGVALGTLVQVFLPWTTGFAIQQSVAKQPGAAAYISLSYAPQVRRHQPSGADAPTLSSKSAPVDVYVPLRIGGVPDMSVLFVDRTSIRIISSAGKLLYEGISRAKWDGGNGRFLESVHTPDSTPHPEGLIDAYQTLAVPAAVYASLKSQPVHLEIDNWMTLLRHETTESVPAVDGQLRGVSGEWCISRIDSDDDDIELGCLIPNKSSSCFYLYLQNRSTGVHNPGMWQCSLDYAPFKFGIYPHVERRGGFVVPLRDKSGLIRYPLNGSALAAAQLVINGYEARAHVRRSVYIPEIRLGDWEEEAKVSSSTTANNRNRGSGGK